MWTRMLALLVCFGIGIYLPASPGWSMPGCVENGKWIRVNTRHFTLISSVDEGRTREMARHLEWLAEALYRRGRSFADSATSDLVVHVFADKACFAPFLPHWNGRTPKLVGYFQPSPFGGVVAFNGSVSSDDFRIACHEYVHAVVFNQIGSLPLCLNEGLAEYFSTFDANDQRAEYGHPIEGNVDWVEASKLLPMDRLFAVTSSSGEYVAGDARSIFYAESWALVHYLNSRQDLRDGFDRFVERLKHGEGSPSAFAASFPGEDWSRIHERLRGYVGADLPHIQLVLGKDFDPVQETAIPIERKEIYSRLGELLSLDGGVSHADVAEYFRAAAGGDSLDARASTALAWHAEISGDTARATDLYRDAVRLGTDGPRVEFARARLALLSRGGITSQPTSAIPPSEWRKLNDLLGQSDALINEGRNAEALALLLEIASSGDPFFVKAAEQRLDYLASQIPVGLIEEGVKKANDGDLQRAIDFFEQARDSAARWPEIRREAEHNLERAHVHVRMNRAIELLKSERPGAARDSLGAIESAMLNDQDRQVVSRLINVADAQIAFEKGLALARAGKLREARALFTSVLELDVDDELKAYARDRILKLDAAMGAKH